MRNTIVIFAVLVSNIQLVLTTSCYCTSRDSVLPVVIENSYAEETSMTFLRNKCFVGRIQGNLFCPENQSFCLNLESLRSTSCGETSQHSLQQFVFVDSKEPVTANPYAKNVYQKRFLVNQNWSDWGLWQECIASHCGEEGIRSRERQCLEAACVGDKAEYSPCFKGCPKQTANQSWSEWGLWQECIASHCGEDGIRSRERQCLEAACVGDKAEYSPCFKNCSQLTVNQSWSEWGLWQECIATKCGEEGIRSRERQCLEAACVGDKAEYSPCFKNCSQQTDSLQHLSFADSKEQVTANVYAENVYQKRFLVNQNWSEWGLWQECIASHCGEEGVRSRERQCLEAPCVGDKAEYSQCFKNCSQQTVSWSDWSIWSQCEVPCSSSSRSNRSRVCMASDGVSCVGNAMEQKTCTVDGGWSEWMSWSANCTADGITYRTRACDNPSALCSGKTCDGKAWEFASCSEVLGWTPWTSWSSCLQIAGEILQLRNRTCREKVCDGKELEHEPCQTFIAWNSWDKCSVSCGEGLQARNRFCIASDSRQPINESFCDGHSMETKPCIEKTCEVSIMPVWSEWSHWSHCELPCNMGISTRTKECIDKSVCQDPLVETVNCSQNLCNIDGGWSVWEEWSQCQSFPDANVVVRYRHCTNPSPVNSGKDCVGDGYDIDTCKYESSWGSWVNSGHCIKTSEDGNTTGLQYRNRTCHIGLSNITCKGSNNEWQPCTRVWSGWGNWSACSKTCGQGSKQRYRHCSDAVDLECAGAGIENQTCHVIENCPVDGKFSEWSAWSQCQVTCDGGSITRNRYCNNPKPQFGGNPCHGNLTEESICNTQDCPVDGHWADWTEWNSCSASCGNGTKVRDRMCRNPAPLHGGKDCEGQNSDTNDCNEAVCSVDGQWGLWESWTQCTCQNVHVRKRNCNNPVPVANGASCVGDATQNESCTPDTSLNCPVNGVWTEWFQWETVCSTTCGHGTVTRMRECSNPKPAYGGAPCPGEHSEGRDCSSAVCPIDGAWSSWSAWSHCDVTCANGTRSRNRTCTRPEPAHGGKDCLGNMVDSKECTLNSCPIDGGWSSWEAWSSWDVTCARGSRSRTRKCDNPAPLFGGHNCPGDIHGFESENLSMCPVDGGWTEWSRWFGCSVTCGPGINHRYRACNNPVPAYHGKPCPDQDFKDTADCNDRNCPIDGSWAEWGAWGSCSASCSNGTRVKNRTCSNPAPMFGGQQCLGSSSETDECYSGHCPIDGSWTDWSSWYSCSVTCGDGYKLRNRSCDNPLPQYNGSYCLGHSIGNGTCNNGHCAIDGAWGSWLVWEGCSTSCGDGTRQRHRKCDRPAPQYGGANCPGNNEYTETCNTRPCPINGLWGSWEPWSRCTGGCATATKLRYRSCNSPVPLYGGAFCKGPPSETTSCLPQNCTVDGAWGSWLAWEGCSSSCGDGIRERHRNCDNPAPQYGGANCTGSNEYTETCNTGPCPINGLWGSWEPWSRCFGDCISAGTKLRYRSCDNPAPLYGGAFCKGPPSETTSCLLQNCTTSMQGTSTHVSTIASSTKMSAVSQNATAGPQLEFKCYVCDAPTPELCVALKREETCHQPYCVNELTNWANGTKILDRRCGTKIECEKDWWKTTSDSDKCTLFDVTQTLTNYVHCTYCCVGELCNDQVVPPVKSLYKPATP